MAICDVLQLGNPQLRELSQPVSDPTAPEIAAIVQDLQDTLAHWRSTTTYGRAISTPQIGIQQRIIFVNIDRPWALINPTIIERSPEEMVVWDACLSFLSIFMQVKRHCWITVNYQDLIGDWHAVKAEGDFPELLQHEIDHLEGILAVERITDMQTLCTREEFEHRYRAESPYAA